MGQHHKHGVFSSHTHTGRKAYSRICIMYICIFNQWIGKSSIQMGFGPGQKKIVRDSLVGWLHILQFKALKVIFEVFSRLSQGTDHKVFSRYYQREQRKTKLLQRMEAAAGQVNAIRCDDGDVRCYDVLGYGDGDFRWYSFSIWETYQILLIAQFLRTNLRCCSLRFRVRLLFKFR